MPASTTVAAPVSELFPISRTGLRAVSVKYPVSTWMRLASTMPMTTATSAISLGSLSLTTSVPCSSPNVAGR